MTKIILQVPDKKTPGYLARIRQMTDLQNRLNDQLTVELIDEMVDFIAKFVIEPTDTNKAKEALFEASEEEFDTMFTQLKGEQNAVPLEKSEESAVS